MSLGFFDETAVAGGWFDESALASGWFDGVSLAGSSGGVVVRCLVLLNGRLKELPQSAPLGSRVTLSAGRLVVAASGGKSLVWDRTTSRIREVNAGETALTP